MNLHIILILLLCQHHITSHHTTIHQIRMDVVGHRPFHCSGKGWWPILHSIARCLFSYTVWANWPRNSSLALKWATAGACTTFEGRKFPWSTDWWVRKLWCNLVFALDLAYFKQWPRVIESDKINKFWVVFFVDHSNTGTVYINNVSM